ncbi:hypothetical protein VUR80DRAFT_8510 [Thermomyces stellatus]
MTMFLVHLLVTNLGLDIAEKASPVRRRTASLMTDCSGPEKLDKASEALPAASDRATVIGSSSNGQDGDGRPLCDLDGAQKHEAEELAPVAQLTAVFILEFGVFFHSVFVGLVLATTDELVIPLAVLVFHQRFEGLGLSARVALVPRPKSRQWLPYALCLVFAISTPLGTAAGMGARPEDAEAQILTTGIFDAVSAGILSYTGMFELRGSSFFLARTCATLRSSSSCTLMVASPPDSL